MSGWILPADEEKREIREAVDADRAYQASVEADRRRRARIGLQADVSGMSQTNFFAGLSEDISEGGVFVATMSPPPVGDTVHLRITVNGDATRSVVVKGTVRWHRTDEAGVQTGCGIQFEELSGDPRRAITALMQMAGREPLYWDV
ncbi:MAG: PilZ domain-containing protein [Myxococcota bacterium]|nr:PilZ domain-containing protein [Myxococcota bacterium]